MKQNVALIYIFPDQKFLPAQSAYLAENILMDPVTRRCKFIDFGSAAIVDDDAWLQIFCGTWHGQEMSFSDRRWNIQSGPCESFAFGALYLQMFHPLADNMYFTENSIESYFAQHRHFIPREAQKVIYELMKADPKKRLRLEHIHEYLQIQPNTHSHPFPSRLKFVIQSGFFIEPPAVNSIQ